MPEEKRNKINVSVEGQRRLKPELALIVYSEGPNMYGHEREKEIIQFMVTANGKFINPKALDMRSMQDIFNSAGKNSTLEYLGRSSPPPSAPSYSSPRPWSTTASTRKTSTGPSPGAIC